MQFERPITVGKITLASVEAAQRFILEAPKEFRDRPHWRYAADVLDQVSMRGGVMAARNAVWIAADVDEHQRA